MKNKFKIGDKIAFIRDPMHLCDDYSCEITGIASFGSSNRYYYAIIDKDGYIFSWYDEDNFITIKEARKRKLKRLDDYTDRYYVFGVC